MGHSRRYPLKRPCFREPPLKQYEILVNEWVCMGESWVQCLKHEIDSKPTRKYKGDEMKLYQPFANWLIENGICESVSNVAPPSLFGFGSTPDLFGYRSNPFTIVLVEVKYKAVLGKQWEGIGQSLSYLGVGHEVFYLNHLDRISNNPHVLLAAERLGIGLCGWKGSGRGFKFNSLMKPVRQDKPVLMGTWDAY